MFVAYCHNASAGRRRGRVLLVEVIQGGAGAGGVQMYGANTLFPKKKKKTKKSILRRFKAIKIFRWYSWSFLILDALRTALKCLKLNFRLVGVVVILVKVGFWVKIRLKVDFSV